MDLSTLNDACFLNFLKLTHQLTGITIAPNRHSMLQGRLRKRVVSLSLNSYEEYYQYVINTPSEKTVFVDLVTTNETYFFRTPRVWDYIEKSFLPNWHNDNHGKTLMVWSAAASSGEEAHSLAVLCQSFKEKNPGFNYQIIGTDVSQEMIGLCQKGLYTGKSIEVFRKNRPESFVKYMKSMGNDVYQLTPEARNRIRFLQHNLFKPLAINERFDLVLLRNVLIYFTGPDQETVLKMASPRLSDQGVLIIGESESLSHIQTDFQLSEPLVYKKVSLNKKTSGAA